MNDLEEVRDRLDIVGDSGKAEKDGIFKSIMNERTQIMPRTERPPGSADELLDVMKVPVAAAMMTPVGRGLGAAAMTLGLMPENSEASLFAGIRNVGKRVRAHGKPFEELHVGSKLSNGRNWIIGAGDEVFEIPTNSMLKNLKEGGKMSKETLAKTVGKFDFQKLKAEGVPLEDMLRIKEVIDGVRNTPISEEPLKMAFGIKKGGMGPTVYGWNNGIGSSINPLISKWDKAKTSIHETGHQAQRYRSGTNDTMVQTDVNLARKNQQEYENRSFEIESRKMEERTLMDDRLTNPEDAYGVHPDLTYKGGKFVIDPDVYPRYKRTGQLTDPKGVREKELIKAADKLNVMLKKDMKFKGLVKEGFGKNVSIKDKVGINHLLTGGGIAGLAYGVDSAIDAANGLATAGEMERFNAKRRALGPIE